MESLPDFILGPIDSAKCTHFSETVSKLLIALNFIYQL